MKNCRALKPVFPQTDACPSKSERNCKLKSLFLIVQSSGESSFIKVQILMARNWKYFSWCKMLDLWGEERKTRAAARINDTREIMIITTLRGNINGNSFRNGCVLASQLLINSPLRWCHLTCDNIRQCQYHSDELAWSHWIIWCPCGGLSQQWAE